MENIKAALLIVLLLVMPHQKTKTSIRTWKTEQPQQLQRVCNVRLSCYHLTKSQTDAKPLEAKWFKYQAGKTAQYFGKHCAISWDLMRAYNLSGGDTVWIEREPGASLQMLIVTDATNRRWKRTIDVVEGGKTKYLHNEAKLYIKNNKIRRNEKEHLLVRY